LHVDEATPSAKAEVLAAQVLGEMAQAWRRGECPTAANYVKQHPQLGEHRDIVLRLVCEELCLRRENHVDIDAAALERQFPQWRQEIEALLACQELIEAETTPKDLGELHDFHLITELGQGGQGRVYLATQPQLADRPVVVKVTACRGEEHLSLARLQHTNIVPLYWVHDHPEQDQRVLCMPYFGSVTLAHILAAVQGVPLSQRTGMHILEALDAGQSQAVPTTAIRSPARIIISRANFAQAVAWMGASLADALTYAHGRDLLHLDIKPSNILWATEGQPMLLDFHLARAPVRRGDPRPRGLGGTPLFMAPEQEAALSAVCHDQPLPQDVDARADVYALGLVLYQSLGGPVPLSLAHPPRLNELNPQVSPGLADIVRKCLQRNPEHRYATAESLAGDLRRHLGDLPLRGVPNRSWAETWDKWRRREPHALARWVIGVAMFAMVVVGALFWWSQRQDRLAQEASYRGELRQRVRRAEKSIDQAQQYTAAKDYRMARAALDSARSLLPEVAEAEATRGVLVREERRVDSLQSLQRLHEIVNVLRQAAVAEELSEAELAQLNTSTQALWDQRGRFLEVSSAADERLRQDITDLAVIWADLRLRAAPSSDAAAARRQVLEVLRQAEEQCGASPLLDQTRLEQLQALGEEDAAAELRKRLHEYVPTSSWEQIAQARRLLQRAQAHPAVGRAAQLLDLCTASSPAVQLWRTLAPPQRLALLNADGHLQRALASAPENFWANYYRGVCAYRLGRSDDAVAAFSACIVLAPRDATYRHNRGLAHAQRGAWREAIADYTRALELNGRFASAALNRGLAHAELGDTKAAVADLERAARLGAPPALVRSNLAVISQRRQ
jgi:serine/threonine protein kinase/Flp pilus assembly protein TadD